MFLPGDSTRWCMHILNLPLHRDLSSVTGKDPLVSVGSISAHTRPVEAIDGEILSGDSGILYSADTMGVLKVYFLERDTTVQPTDGLPPRWRTTLQEDLIHHRTRINQLILHNGYIWTGTSPPGKTRAFRALQLFP